MVILALAILGLAFGSFINALTWRLHKKKDWVKARSQCTHCGHTLHSLDLIPVVSWLALGGRCRYCKKAISIQYPLVELAGALVATLSYTFWPASFDDRGQVILLGAWLISAIGLLALVIYDFRWMLLPNKLIYPTLGIAALGNLLFLTLTPDRLSFIRGWLLSLLIASGIFWVLYMISNGKWIGYGDVRLGLVTGTLLHSPTKSFLMIFFASILGTFFVLPSLIKGGRSMTARLPFGPFLIVGTGIALIFGDSLINWYLGLFNF
jgi:prepilin signal peptidase PulO-like enzyme (type II secretory pathway)